MLLTILAFIAILLFVGGVALLFWMLYENNHFEINEHQAKIRKSLKRSFRALHLSDIHFAKPRPPLARFFERLAMQDFDFIFVTGDILDCEEGIPTCIEYFKKLKARYGIFAVFGNHDYYDYAVGDVMFHNRSLRSRVPRNTIHANKLQDAFEAIGVTVLKNESRHVDMDGMPIMIHGVDDPVTGRANIRAALADYDPAKVNLLLTHSADIFLDIGENEMDVSFSGHLHGGQIRLPYIGPIIVPTVFGRPYTSGLKKLKGAICSISRGLGSSRFFPLRLLCRPEAIVVEICDAVASKTPSHQPA